MRLVSALLALAMMLSAGTALSAGRVALSPDEAAWIAAHPLVKMCVDPDWVPFERIDEQGRHQGIAADLVQLVAQRVGLRIEVLPTRDWNESLRASQAGRCRILSFVNQTPARDAWLIFTEPIFLDSNVFITREEHRFIADPRNLSDESIALPRGTMVEERIRHDYPNLRVITTGSESEAVELVEKRRADMTMRSLIVAAYTIRKDGLFNLKIAGQIPEYANQLRIGVVKDDLMLRTILDKGVRSITTQEREAVVNRHISIQVQKGIDYVLIWKIVGAALLLIAIAVYWNRRLAQFNARLRQANEDISAAQRATREALYQVETLLDNAAQGFLSFAADLRVRAQFSQPCIAMFGSAVAGADIAELLLPDDAAAAAQLRGNLQRVFAGTDEFQQEVLISLLPALFRRRGLALAAHYKLLADGSMMLVLDDVTAKLALEEQVRQEQSRLKLVVSVFREREDVRRLAGDFRDFLAGDTREPNGDALFRQIHTFKGAFAQFNFCHLPAALHRAEENRLDNALADDAIDDLYAAWAADVTILRDILGYDPFLAEEQLLVDAARLRGLEDAAASLSPAQIRRELARLRHRPLVDLLGAYPRFCRLLAQRLDKEIHDFQIEGERLAVDPERFAPFLRSLGHVFRNAVDHGIESVEERLQAGKDGKGTLRCVVTRRGEAVRLEIADDGRGIDEASLRSRAQALDITLPEAPRMLIFADALSTREEASEVSGRGIGLAAVGAELRKLAGQVTVESTPGQGTRLIFNLPLNDDEC